MGPGALVYPPGCTDTNQSLHYHPYHNHYSFNNLRHYLPPAISASCYSPDCFDKPWDSLQPVCGNTYMPHPSYPSNNGQDAGYPFPQTVSHFSIHPYDTEPKFNAEDFEFGSGSGDDDTEELDSNAQLRSQQLNSDGTPKRPMNAFMIFARKRRPMVSSEQPTMRTGEISKILSKEWSEMPKEEKQFYLDQAKKLKDTFNTRWPDYVYRRRPNNSRKRRKLGNASGAVLSRDCDNVNRIDGQLDGFRDHSMSSGDESKSQSTSSPLATQLPLLAHSKELSHSHLLDRSPTPSSVLAGYGRSTSSPFHPPSRLGFPEDHLPSAYAAQGHPFGEGAGTPYSTLSAETDLHNRLPGFNPVTNGWRSLSAAPSGVVGPTAASTPSSSPVIHVMPRIHPSAQPPSSEAHPHEAPSILWGASPRTAGHHGLDSHGVGPVLPSPGSGSHLDFAPTASPHHNALGMHLYGREKDAPEDSRLHPAYIEPNGFNHLGPQAHVDFTPPAFENDAPGSHGNLSSAYFGSTVWSSNEHSG